MGWSISDIPSQQGRTAVVTGTGGLGYETAVALARAGAEVIVAGRNPSKGEQALAKVRAEVPNAKVSFEQVDLASLASVAAFAERLKKSRKSLDILVNNAGLMAPPKRQATADGFEMQFGTNHLGHFALTGGLLPLLRKAPAPRVVSVASGAAHQSKGVNFSDLQAERDYKPFVSYSQSKLANVLFALELQRRSDANGWGLVSSAAHPGFARTELIDNAQEKGAFKERLMRVIEALVSQSAAEGALPILYAATAPEAKGGLFYGPDGWAEMKGAPKVGRMPKPAGDTAAAQRLWEVSEQLTGVTFA